MTMDSLTLIEAINNGQFDNGLEVIGAAIEMRYEAIHGGRTFFAVSQQGPNPPSKSIAKQRFYPGQQAKFGHEARPRYLLGCRVRVVEVKRLNVVVRFEHDLGRFHTGDTRFVNHTWLDVL